MPGRPGEYATVVHTELLVTGTTQAALALNHERVYAMFQNDSDLTIYLRLGEDAIDTQGIRLNANGGSYEISDRLGNLFAGAVNAIAAGGSNNLLILEATN